MTSRIDTVNVPLQKAKYLFAHEQLRNARRRHAETLGMGSGRILRADTSGRIKGATRLAGAGATDIGLGK
jgi:hypothetical protein